MIYPPFEKYPVLRTDRITLRLTTHADAPSLVNITTYQRVPVKNIEETIEVFDKVYANYLTGDSVHWCIEDNATQVPVGCIGFYRGFKDETAEVGYVMKPEYRGKGYMSEAVQLVVQFGFETMQLKNIIAYTGPQNTASHGVLLKNGFQEKEVMADGDLKFVRLP